MSTHPDPAALLERLKQFRETITDGEYVHWSQMANVLTDAITALSAAPSGCAEAGERVEDRKELVEGIVAKIEGMYPAQPESFYDGVRRCAYYQLHVKALRPSPSPAGGADGADTLLLAVAEGVLTSLEYPRGSEAQVRCLEEVGQDARHAIDAALAATQATPAKDGK